MVKVTDLFSGGEFVRLERKYLEDEVKVSEAFATVFQLNLYDIEHLKNGGVLQGAGFTFIRLEDYSYKEE